MIGSVSLRRTLAAGGILALAWAAMGATPLSAPAGLTNAPQFAVNRLDKGDRLPMTRAAAVRRGRHPLSRLLDSDFPSNWQWS
jgi:hypothetical protein